MKMKQPSVIKNGFTLIEALMTVAIIGIMAALVISAYSSASADTNRIVARQQQAALQTAVIAWVNSDGNRVDVSAASGAVNIRTVAEIQTDYNSRTTSLARLNLVATYLDSTTSSMFLTSSLTSDKITSDALNTSAQHLTLPTWSGTDYPQVSMVSN